MSTYKARVVTKQFKIETRQHELFGLDLGEGPRRRDLGLGLIIIPVWVGFMWLLLGPPEKYTMLLYMAPPVLMLMYGIQENSSNPRRMNATVWLLTLRYGLVGHRPIIRGGARPASRQEYISFTDRWPIHRIAPAVGMKHLVNTDGTLNWTEVANIPGLGWTARYATRDHDRSKRPSGPPVAMRPTVYLYSTEEIAAVAHRQKAKREKKTKA